MRTNRRTDEPTLFWRCEDVSENHVVSFHMELSLVHFFHSLAHRRIPRILLFRGVPSWKKNRSSKKKKPLVLHYLITLATDLRLNAFFKMFKQHTM